MSSFPPESKEEIERAVTEMSAPPTEPLFRGDVRLVVMKLLELTKEIGDGWESLVDRGLSAPPSLNPDEMSCAVFGKKVRAMQGVAAMLTNHLAPRTHALKTDPDMFALVASGAKRFEVRTFDRDFQVGDFLKLMEFDRATAKYSGAFLRVKVTSIVRPGSYGLPAKLGVLGIEPVEAAP